MNVGRRVSIVFEEVTNPDGSIGFNVSLDGASFLDLQAMGDDVRRNEASTAAFWAYECMVRGVLPLLHRSGARRGAAVVPKKG